MYRINNFKRANSAKCCFCSVPSGSLTVCSSTMGVPGGAGVMTVQTQVMRKVYDPDKMRKEIEAQIAEKKKQEKRCVKNTTVKVTDPKTGKTTEKNLSASEMNKRRLEYARKQDEERYKDERTVPLSELNKQDKE